LAPAGADADPAAAPPSAVFGARRATRLDAGAVDARSLRFEPSASSARATTPSRRGVGARARASGGGAEMRAPGDDDAMRARADADDGVIVRMTTGFARATDARRCVTRGDVACYALFIFRLFDRREALARRDETRRDGDGDGDGDAMRCESNYMSTFSLKHYQRYLTDAFG